MARITVDDCIKHFPNRFELTLAATNRARQIALGDLLSLVRATRVSRGQQAVRLKRLIDEFK